MGQAQGRGPLHRVIVPPVPSVFDHRTPQELPLQSMEGCSRSLIISAWDRCERAGYSAVDRLRKSLGYRGYRLGAALSAAPATRMNVLCLCYEANTSACLSRCRILYGANCSSIVLITSWSSADTRDAAFFRTLICSAHSVCNCG